MRSKALLEGTKPAGPELADMTRSVRHHQWLRLLAFYVCAWHCRPSPTMAKPFVSGAPGIRRHTRLDNDNDDQNRRERLEEVLAPAFCRRHDCIRQTHTRVPQPGTTLAHHDYLLLRLTLFTHEAVGVVQGDA